ncbi:unnamed protein product [Caenorhabditis bovis]|uniref:Uncharacterized protein n=1 Tax=Caenorhabditis bovis TaxID=2654633 RepID=A0A8S1EUD1_9PELO|nr:unnamed protein product [Caenorhabditis bovis]
MPMMILNIVLILSMIAVIGSSNSYRHQSNRCYSCMSEMYEAFFANGLDRYFNKPRNFSSQCDNEMNVTSMQLVPCRTICLTIQQDLYVMGQPTGHRLFMRGCALSIARKGLYNRTLSLFDKYDLCRDMSARDLFYHEHSDSQRIRVCSCLGDRCNSAQSTSNAQSFIDILAISVMVASLF